MLYRSKEIKELNGYLERVLAGEEQLDLQNQKEGELSILRSNIYKTTCQLIAQREAIKRDREYLSSALEDISHQLKTPLTSMTVMNDLLKSEEDTEKRMEFLEVQSAQLDRMNWLIKTLLKLSKFDAGVVEMERTDVNVEKLIENVISPFMVQMDLRNIKYEWKIEVFDINCNINWMVEAMQNIVKNCIEHMDNGGKLCIETRLTNLFWEISISDTGCGIEPADLPHIFERFYKGKNAGKDSVGIGLALSKTIVQQHNGDILVDSVIGEGTTFNIRIYKTII